MYYRSSCFKLNLKRKNYKYFKSELIKKKNVYAHNMYYVGIQVEKLKYGYKKYHVPIFLIHITVQPISMLCEHRYCMHYTYLIVNAIKE